MAIPAISITSRLSAYSCCAATAGYSWVVKEALGDPCWEEDRRRYRFLSWAMGVLSRYPLEGDPCSCDGCVTEDFVNQVISVADPGCVRCACPTGPPAADPCAIAINFRVLNTIVTADIPLAADGQYLITDYGGNPSAIIIDVVGGVLYNPFVVPNGQVVYTTVTDIYYSAFNNATTLLFPGITVGTLPGPDNFSIISDNAPYAFAQNRTIRIEATMDGIAWLTAYNGQEQDISNGLAISTAPTITNPTAWRITYIEGACEYGPVDASAFNNTPPFTYEHYGTQPPFPATNPIRIHSGEVYGPFVVTDAFNEPRDNGNGRMYRIRKAKDLPNSLVAVGWYGSMRVSQDGGQTWATPTGNWSASPDILDYDVVEMTSLFYVGFGVYVAGGRGGALFLSTNYGNAFNYIPQGAFTFVTAVAALDSLNVFVGTFGDGLWRTTDGGGTWSQIAGVAGTISHIDTNGQHVLVFIQGSGCYWSQDQGATFSSINTAPQSVRDSQFLPDGQTVYAVGLGRFKSTDAGQTWTVQETSLSTRYGVAPLNNSIVLYSATNGVQISLDGGQTISQQTATTNGGIYAIEGHIFP